jgi:hypothetical protein
MKPATIAAWPREARDEAARFAWNVFRFSGLMFSSLPYHDEGTLSDGE